MKHFVPLMLVQDRKRLAKRYKRWQWQRWQDISIDLEDRMASQPTLLHLKARESYCAVKDAQEGFKVKKTFLRSGDRNRFSEEWLFNHKCWIGNNVRHIYR